MRLIKYLSESTDINEIITLIQKDCQPFLKDWKKLNINKFLYSGRKISIDFTKKIVRKNRVPLDTSYDVHEVIDDWFYKKFKVRSRSNAVFCTFDLKETSRYGNPYMIFPIGRYKAISSKKVKDLYFDADAYHQNWYINQGFWKELLSDTFSARKDRKINTIKFLDLSDYREGLRLHGNELMVTCKDYYMVSMKYENDILKALK